MLFAYNLIGNSMMYESFPLTSNIKKGAKGIIFQEELPNQGSASSGSGGNHKVNYRRNSSNSSSKSDEKKPQGEMTKKNILSAKVLGMCKLIVPTERLLCWLMKKMIPIMKKTIQLRN